MLTDSKYVVISPAKDEAGRIEATIQSMLSQTIRPIRWVIVDDASRDRTPGILEFYRQQVSWITVIRVDRDAERKLGSAEILAFEVGFRSVESESFDFIVKLDCDLKFAPDYFEQLLARFHAAPNLGIASGVYLERNGSGWVEVKMPRYHASGASKMIRAKCYADIGGFPLSPGWDSADEIKAQMKGWKTGHFSELRFYHLRREGSASGVWGSGMLHGRIYYVTGGGPLFFLFKFGHRLFTSRPGFRGAIAMLFGYVKAYAIQQKRLVTEVEARFYRRQLNRRLFEGFHKMLKLIDFPGNNAD